MIKKTDLIKAIRNKIEFMGAGPDRPENGVYRQEGDAIWFDHNQLSKMQSGISFPGFWFCRLSWSSWVGGVDLLTAVVAILFIVPKINPFQSN